MKPPRNENASGSERVRPCGPVPHLPAPPRARAGLLDRGYDITRLVFDRGYSALTAEKFHQPLADRNIDVVKHYIGGKHDSQLGIGNGVGGAPLADDRYFCPGRPKGLLETGNDLDDGTICEEQHWKNLKTREDYELHLHDRAKDGSQRQRQEPAGAPLAQQGVVPHLPCRSQQHGESRRHGQGRH